MARKNRTPEENARREKIRELLQMANIGSMEDIQSLFKENIVIAEKPSVGVSIAAVLGAKKRQEGYMEGNGYLVSWCIGHLCDFVNADVYDAKYSKWRYDDLPIIPNPWSYQTDEKKVKQYTVLKTLLRDFKAAGAKGIQECKIRSVILPLLADHVLREANHYIRLLKG
ncbi:MAG: DUF2935 domain-containing protein [Faecousia sp.]